MKHWDGARLRAALGDARVMLVFTPQLTGARDPLAVLETLLPFVDIIQVRPKDLGDPAGAPTDAAQARDLSRAVLDLVWASEHEVPVMVNDRVDVAVLLANEGLAGVHLGQNDLPWEDARAQLGPDPLIGLSTHDPLQVARALEAEVDYLGFGPVFPTETKGYTEGVSPEAAWVASQASTVPVFPIGGIHLGNAQELTDISRAAVGSAILSADDPAAAARSLRELLETP